MFPDVTTGLITGEVVRYTTVLQHSATSDEMAFHVRLFDDNLRAAPGHRYQVVRVLRNTTVLYSAVGGSNVVPHAAPPRGRLNTTLATDGLLFYINRLALGDSIVVHYDIRVGDTEAFGAAFPGPRLAVHWTSHPDPESVHTQLYTAPSSESSLVPTTSSGLRMTPPVGVLTVPPPAGENFVLAVRSNDENACGYISFIDGFDDTACLGAMTQRGLPAVDLVNCMTLRFFVPETGGCLARATSPQPGRRLQTQIPELFVDLVLPLDVLAETPPEATVGMAVAGTGAQAAECVASEQYDKDTAVFSSRVCLYDVPHAFFVYIPPPSPSPSPIPIADRDDGGVLPADTSANTLLIVGLVFTCLAVVALGAVLGVKYCA